MKYLLSLTLLTISLASPLTPLKADFATQLYQKVKDENPGGNILISPYSAAVALSMAWEGAVNTVYSPMHTIS